MIFLQRSIQRRGVELSSENNHIHYRCCAAISLLPNPSPVRNGSFDPTSLRREASLFNLAGAFGLRPFFFHRSTDCYPHELAGWAKAHDLPVFFVDNEWVRVPVSAQQLKIFATEVLGIGDVAYLISQADDAEGLVVIESEAFGSDLFRSRHIHDDLSNT